MLVRLNCTYVRMLQGILRFFKVVEEMRMGMRMNMWYLVR